MNDGAQTGHRGARMALEAIPIVAFCAAAIWLWRSDSIPDIEIGSLSLLCLASTLQLLGFFMRAWLMRDMLERFQLNLPYSAAVVGVFKPVLAKYIPGKIWLLVSTAGLLGKHGIPFGRASVVIAVFQVTLAISGLALGGLALLAVQLPGVSESQRLLLLFLVLALSIALLGSHKSVLFLLHKVAALRKWLPASGDFPALAAPAAYAILHWLVIGLSFTVFLMSVNVDASWYPVVFQPLAINLGVIAIVFPGGLGVREGVMAAYLGLIDIPLAQALALAVAARIWFFAGEVVVFLIGMLLDRHNHHPQIVGA